jgi:hypothetical protein
MINKKVFDKTFSPSIPQYIVAKIFYSLDRFWDFDYFDDLWIATTFLKRKIINELYISFV